MQSIADPSGRRVVISGATGGIGFETALALAGAGARVMLTGRDAARGEAALRRIRAAHPSADIVYCMLDLSSLADVAGFVAGFGEGALDVLVNNAGIMALARRQTTKDGFEAQFGVNFLGHFALTAGLLPALRRGRAPRVVNLSSLTHRTGRIDFPDLQGQARYRPWGAYAQSKLAMLLFSLELQRRSVEGGWGVASIAAHPGWARTGLLASAGGGFRLQERAMEALSHIFGQSAAAGALPTLYAATAPEAEGGAYYGPDGMGEMTGAPARARLAPQASDTATARRLWAVAEALTGVRF